MRKKLDAYFDKVESLSLEILENEIKRAFQKYLRACAGNNEKYWRDKIKYCLSRRKWLLNSTFEFTPERVQKIAEINSLLMEATTELNQKSQAILTKLHGQNDSFYEAFQLESSIMVDFACIDDNRIDMDDEDANKSDYREMTEILDEFPAYRVLHRICETSESQQEIDDKLNQLNWDIEELNRPELKSIPFFCYASHCLISHLYYSFQDIMRIKQFKTTTTISLDKWDETI